jgi:hypothetical protein
MASFYSSARRWGLCSSRGLFVNSRVRFVRVVRVSPVCISVLIRPSTGCSGADCVLAGATADGAPDATPTRDCAILPMLGRSYWPMLAMLSLPYTGYAHAVLCWCFILAYSDSDISRT